MSFVDYLEQYICREENEKQSLYPTGNINILRQQQKYYMKLQQRRYARIMKNRIKVIDNYFMEPKKYTKVVANKINVIDNYF